MAKRKQNEDEIFDEFVGFTGPEGWPIISAFINNLAEFKIVEYIYRNCWDMPTEITIEQFMHGYCDEEGYKIDCGTGLSKPSVIAGIRRAIKHGLIECDTDESDKTHIRKYYQIRMAQVGVKNVYPEDEISEIENNFYIAEDPVNNLYPEEVALEAEEDFLPPSNNSNNTHIDNTSNIIRITERQQFFDKQRGKEKYPAFIRSDLKELSCDLGDGEHIASNIAQASKLYEQSGLSQDEFAKLLYEVKEIARGKVIKKLNSRGRPNRMPFFFSCLRNLLKKQEAQAN
jgi:hypothetical protein